MMGLYAYLIWGVAMSRVKNFDKNRKPHTLVLTLILGVLSLSPVLSLAEPGQEEAPILPVESSSTSQETISVRMVGAADEPQMQPSISTQATETPVAITELPRQAEVSETPVSVTSVETPSDIDRVVSVQSPQNTVPLPSSSTMEFSSYGRGEPVPAEIQPPVQTAPVIENVVQVPTPKKKATFRGNTGNQGTASGVVVAAPPIQDTYTTEVTTLGASSSNSTLYTQSGYQPPAPPAIATDSSASANGIVPTPTKKATFRKQNTVVQPTPSIDYGQLYSQAAKLKDSGDSQGAERIIQSLPLDRQAEARVFVNDRGVTDLLPAQEVAEIVLDPTKKIKAVGVVGEVVFKTTSEATKAAVKMGYRKIRELSNGEAVYKKGNSYITRDIGSGNGLGSHNGGAWKEASSVKNLGTPETRNGTFNADLSEMVGK